jgi:hypothetical protein
MIRRYSIEATHFESLDVYADSAGYWVRYEDLEGVPTKRQVEVLIEVCQDGFHQDEVDLLPLLNWLRKIAKD